MFARNLAGFALIALSFADLALAGTPPAPKPWPPRADRVFRLSAPPNFGGGVPFVFNRLQRFTATVRRRPLIISWSSVSDPSGIIGYNWQVSPTSGFSSVVLQNSTNGQTQGTVAGLANGTYFWRVQAVNGALVEGMVHRSQLHRDRRRSGVGRHSDPAAHERILDLPSHGSAVTNAASYTLQYSTDATFPVSTSGQFNNIVSATMSFAIADANEGNHYARVFAMDANGITGVPSNVISFSVSSIIRCLPRLRRSLPRTEPLCPYP